MLSGGRSRISSASEAMAKAASLIVLGPSTNGDTGFAWASGVGEQLLPKRPPVLLCTTGIDVTSTSPVPLESRVEPGDLAVLAKQVAEPIWGPPHSPTPPEHSRVAARPHSWPLVNGFHCDSPEPKPCCAMGETNARLAAITLSPTQPAGGHEAFPSWRRIRRSLSPRPRDFDPLSLSRELTDHKNVAGLWNTVLTDLPTIELNAFLKQSHFGKSEIVDLKKVRRQRKNAVYTKRSRARRTHRRQNSAMNEGAACGVTG